MTVKGKYLYVAGESGFVRVPRSDYEEALYRQHDGEKRMGGWAADGARVMDNVVSWLVKRTWVMSRESRLCNKLCI